MKTGNTHTRLHLAGPLCMALFSLACAGPTGTGNGGSGGRTVRRCDPVAETLEPRGESSLVVRRFFAVAFIATRVSHCFDPRGFKGSALFPPP